MTASNSNGRGRDTGAGRARTDSPSAGNELGRLREFGGLAWLLIPLMATAMVTLWVADVRVVWPLPPVKWVIHYGPVALGVAFIVIPAARSFLGNGEPSVLMLGCGMLMMDVGAAAMPSAFTRSSDAAFAIYNTSTLLGALCHFTGVAITSRRKLRLRPRATWLTAVYAGGTAAMGLVIWAALAGWMPVFFIDGRGGTLLRSLVVSTAVALFVLTAGLLWQTNRHAASPFLYWYALGLGLLAAGLAGSMAIAVTDSPLQWVARSTQAVGTVYMCVAVLTSARASIAKGIPLGAVAQSWRENELLAGLRQQTPLGWGLRYGLAVGAVAAAWGLRLALTAWVGPALPPFITFYPAIMLVALLAGLGPGLLATAMAFAIVGYWILPPVGQLAILSPADRLGLALFTSMGLVMSLVAEFYRQSRDKAAAYDREAALREGRKRMAAFAQATFEGIVESDGGRMVDCNEQFARMTGYAVAELRGMEIAHLVAPEDRGRVAANIQQNRDSVIEHLVLRKDGARVVVEAHGRPGSPDGTTRHTVIRDITERKRAEQALKESEERSRNIVKYAPAAIYEMSVDGERFISVNDAMCQVLGYSREELLELRPRELLDDESRAVFQERIKKKLVGAEVGESVEYRAKTKDRRWIDGIINIGSLTYKDARPDSVLVIAHDISARKRLERLYAVLSRVNETIVRTDDEQVLYQDVCRIVAEDGGFPLVWIGTVTGREVHRVASSGAAVSYLNEIRVEVDGPLGSGPTGTSIRENRSVINDDFDTNPAAKPWRQSALSHGFGASAAFPLHRAGKTVGALTLYAARPGAFDLEQVKLLEALSADVSYALEAMDQERRRAEAERALRESEQSLRQIDQGKDEFLAMLSHELRNPLSPIANSLFILDRAVPGGEQANRAKAIIARQVGQLTRLVDDLLDVTRITRGKFRLQRARFDLTEMARRAADDHRAMFVDAGITFDVRTGARPLWVDGDEARMAQVVGNLLTNSAKFTANGGTVALELEADTPGGMAVLRVRDTGAGITPSMLPKLFEPFIQADESLDRSKGGLGLGLALVKGIVEMHGGRVEAHSEGAGTGAEFVIRLPAELGEAAPLRASGPPSRHPPRRVLVIEDNEDAADSLRDVLEFGEHQVEVAHSGPAGLEKAREFRPEVVICDIGLPGMSGYEVAGALRGDEVLRTAHLVALTGYALPDDQRRAREAGFEHHLPKPTSIEKIEELFANLPPPEAD